MSQQFVDSIPAQSIPSQRGNVAALERLYQGTPGRRPLGVQARSAGATAAQQARQLGTGSAKALTNAASKVPAGAALGVLALGNAALNAPANFQEGYQRDINSRFGNPVGAGIEGTLEVLGELVPGRDLARAAGDRVGEWLKSQLFSEPPPGSFGQTEVEGPPPFVGGQMEGVAYRVTAQPERDGVPFGSVSTREGPGPIGYIQGENPTGGSFARITNQVDDGWFVAGTSAEGVVISYRIDSVERVDGLPDTGPNLPGAPVSVPASPPRVTPVGAPPPQPLPTADPSPPPSDPPPSPPPDLLPNPTLPLAGLAAGALGIPLLLGNRPQSVPRPNTQPSVGGQRGPNLPPPPPPVKTKPNCGCNSGVISGVSNQLNNKLGGLQDTAQNAQLAAILAKVNQIQSFAESAWQNTHADKLINLLTLVTTLHNASMISRDIGETLGYVLSNALAVVGVKDENGQALDINGLVGQSVESFLRSVLGNDVYEDTRTQLQKANRVLQSASNIVWTIRSINDTTQDVMEWTAENTGKIGNALKKYGVVGDRAYPWMSERVKAQDFYRRRFSRVFEGLESVEETASSLAVVTGNVREIQEEVNELGEARTRFTDAVSAFGPEDTPGLDPANQLPTSAPENQPIATAEEAATTVSQSPDIAISTDAQRGDPLDGTT